jgi:Spy/CpxP family protein refolding chaperone
MKTINAIFLLLPQLLIGSVALSTLAQPTQQSIVKEHLEYCVGQLNVQMAQAEAIGSVMHQQSLTQEQKLEQVGQILTPEQKQQLLNCMEKPVPPQQ